MNAVKEILEVVGELETVFGRFHLLRRTPNVHSVPFVLRENGFVEWYVIDQEGYATNILVKGDALIRPLYEPIKMEVKFRIEESNPNT